MSAFQYIGLAVFGVLAAVNLRRLALRRPAPLVSISWFSLAFAGAMAMVAPEETTRIARKLGIQRGADLLLYTSVLTGMIITFLIFTRMRATDRRVTLLVRELALASPVTPSPVQPDTDLEFGSDAAADDTSDFFEATARQDGAS